MRSARTRVGTIALLGALMLVLLACGDGDSAPAESPDTETEVSTAAPSGAATDPQASGEPTELVVVTGLPLGHPAVSFAWIGGPLGFYEEENVSVDWQSTLGNPDQALAIVVGGRGDILYFGIDTLLLAAARDDDVPLTNIFSVYPRGIFVQAVLPDSDIQSFADFEGKTIGIPAGGPTQESYLNAALKEVGLTLDDVELLPTGLGPPMAEALNRGEVDAIVGTFGQIVALESQGYELRYLPEPEVIDQMIGAGHMMRRDLTPEKQEAIGGFLRGFAKSMAFAKANPQAAVEIAWEAFPEAAPTGVDREQAVANAVSLVELVMSEYAGKFDGRWGYTPPERLEQLVEILGLSDQITDLDSYYTNDYIDEANDFDEQAVMDQARDYGGE